MKKSVVNTIILAIAAVLVGASSYYVTDVQQEKRIERLHDARRVAELQNVKADELLVQLSSSAKLAESALTRWESRYKYIPTSLNTADMVEYLEGLTRNGFEQFDLLLDTQVRGPDFSTNTFKVNGTAYYGEFYHLLWHLENNREFYRIRDLRADHVNVFKRNRSTDVERRLDMVAFSFELDAYYAGIQGISAPGDSLRPIPLAILQDHRPPDASFTPLVRTDLPPNDEMLLDIENADLLAIMGQQAIFEDKYGRHIVLEGDRIYLGEVVMIDPVNSFVRVQLNKGDRTETMNVRVGEGEGTTPKYRQALGDDVQLEPIERGQ